MGINLKIAFIITLNIVMFTEFTSLAQTRASEYQQNQKENQNNGPVYSPLKRKPYTRSTKLA